MLAPRYPDKPTPPSVFLLVVALAAMALFAAGIYLIYLSFGQPPEKLELAMQARRFGIWLVAGSTLVGIGVLAWRRYID